MRIFLTLLLLCISVAGHAHKASDSYLNIDLDETGGMRARWDIALRDLDLLLDLDADRDRRLTWGEVASQSAALERLVGQNLQLQRGGQACAPYRFAPLAIDRHTDGQYAVLTVTSQCADSGSWMLGYRLLARIDAGHRGIVRVRQAGQAPRTLVLTPSDTPVTLAGGAHQTLAGFWREGVGHIWAGYDHMLFLLSLLLPVVLVRRAQGWQPVARWQGAAWDAAGIVTAFTLAHSLTLGLAALHWVHLPSRWVEAAIAASVIIAALHNLRPLLHRWRWLLAFGFGLVHGFGFASALADLTEGGEAQVLALLGFNLGVETGQLAIVVLFIPLAYALRGTRPYQRWLLPGGSLAIASVAGLWLCQRLLNITLIPG